MTEIMTAASQWLTRPDDERFWTIQEARVAAYEHAERAIESAARPSVLRVREVGDEGQRDLRLVGANGQPAMMTHYAFGQLCRSMRVPADYMRRLPTSMAAQNLNYNLQAQDVDDEPVKQLLFHQDGEDVLTLRSWTSDRYARIWNWEVADRLLPFTNLGWKVPPARPANPDDPRARPATADDLIEGNKGGIQVKEGDMIAPAGVYVSDHDCFFLMVHPERSFGEEDRFMRGMIWRNSEVGDGALVGLAFIFDGVCGNHIIWGVQQSLEFRLRHVGSVKARWGEARGKVTNYMNSRTDTEENAIEAARRFRLGDDRDEAEDFLFSDKKLGLPLGLIRDGLDRAAEREDRYGDPLTAWAFVGGLTELARDIPHGDKKVTLETAGGKVLKKIAF